MLPIIAGNKFVGRFEPVMNRKNKELIIQNWWWEKDTDINQDLIDALIRCLKDFIQFLNAKKISVSNTLVKDGFGWIKDCL